MKKELSPAMVALLVVGGIAILGLLGFALFSSGAVTGPKNDFKPVPMPGAAPPKPGEKRGPGSRGPGAGLGPGPGVGPAAPQGQ